MPVRLIASDLDGTLLRSDATVSPRTARVVAAAEDAGVPFVLVTGRSPRSMHVIAELTGHHGIAICANGAIVFDLHTSSVLELHALPAETALRLVHELRLAVPGVAVACERGFQPAHEWASESRVEIPDGSLSETRRLLALPIANMLVRHAELTAAELLHATKDLFDGFAELATVTYGASMRVGGRLQITGPEVTKAFSLARLADDLGADPDDVVAFGDMPNDLPMLSWAGLGVAVGNAHPEVVALADEVTASNDEDGVAVVVERELALRLECPPGRARTPDCAVPLVVVISGPIGSGKSTVARAVAERLRGSGRTVAVIDLDVVVSMIGGFEGLSATRLRAAREVHGRLVGSWFNRGADVVVHGPFLNAEAEAPFMRELLAGVEPRRVRLLVSYDVALRRVTADEMPRNLSRDPQFLRRAHDRFGEMVPAMPVADWTFDTETMDADDIAAVIEAALRADASMGSEDDVAVQPPQL